MRYPDFTAQDNCAGISPSKRLKLSLPTGVSGRLQLAMPPHPIA